MGDFSIEAWYVVRTQPKRERSSSAYLRKELGLEVVAPQISYDKITRRGKVRWREAMFPGYVFAKFSREQMEKAVCYSPGVLCLVRFGESVPAVDESFLLGLRDVVGDDEELELEHQLIEGDEYEVATGPMKGQKGKVMEVLSGGDRVKLMFDMIGSERSIDLDILSLLLPTRPPID